MNMEKKNNRIIVPESLNTIIIPKKTSQMSRKDQKILEKQIKQARRFGFLPFVHHHGK